MNSASGSSKPGEAAWNDFSRNKCQGACSMHWVRTAPPSLYPEHKNPMVLPHCLWNLQVLGLI